MTLALPHQEASWLADRLAGSAGRHLYAALRLHGTLDTDSLAAALTTVAARYPALRQTFHWTDGHLVTRPLPPGPASLTVTGPDIDCDSQAARDVCAPFDLAHGPLLRAHLYRAGQSGNLLVLTGHPIACDAETLAALANDLSLTYEAITDGRTIPDGLPSEARPTGGPSTSSTARPDRGPSAGSTAPPAGGPSASSKKGGWVGDPPHPMDTTENPRRTPSSLPAEDRLSGAPLLINWPSGRPRRARPSGPATTLRTRLKATLADRAAQLATDLEVERSTVLLAALRCLLTRHTRQPDLLIGTSVTPEGSPGPEDEVLPIRNDLTSHLSFRTVVRHEAEALESAGTRRVPLLSLASALHTESDLTAGPIVQVAYSYHPREQPDRRWGGLPAETVQLDLPESAYELAIRASETDEGLSMAWDHAVAVINRHTAQELADRFEILLTGALDDPDQPISALPYLTDHDQRERAARERGPHAATPASMVDLVDRWVELTPEAVAVRFGADQRTYRQLAEDSDAIAAGLTLAPESRIGVMLPRSADLPAVLLAVAKAGHVCVPLDPTHPPERLAHVITDARVAALLVETGTDLSAIAADVLVLHPGDLKRGTPEARPRRPLPGGLAYVLYTSGSTGPPKGVAVTHGGLANCLAATRRLMDYRPGQRLLAVTTISFDIAMLEIFLPLVSGGETILATTKEARDGEALQAALRRWRPHVVQATPLTWQMLFLCGWTGDPDLVVSCGGDVVTPALAARLIACVRTLWHTYGPTETSLYTACQIVEPGPQPPVVPVGGPIDGTYFRLLDDRLRPVPPGVIGELCIGGAGLARGYVGQPELTATRFVPDPDGDGERLYRTGDLARWRSDGRLELHGRNDRQVKIRGHRIEPGEIESVLFGHPEVALAAAVVTGDRSEARQIIAYVQVRSEAAAGRVLNELPGYVRERLPEVMVPAAYGVVDPMPVRTNGKVDRTALARLKPPQAGRRPPAPADEVAAWIVRTWSKVLGLRNLSSDDFLALGGNLRHAATVQELAARELGIRLPLGSFAETPTIEALARRLRQARLADTAREPSSLRWLRGGEEPALVFAVAGSAPVPYAEDLAGIPDTKWPVALLTVKEEPAGPEAADLARLPAAEGTVLVGVGDDVGPALRLSLVFQRETGIAVGVLAIDAPPPDPHLLARHRGSLGYACVSGPGEWLADWRRAAPRGLVGARILSGRHEDVARRLAALAAALG
ncbi:non-ribosomal peptide synthetase [Acrocarpospora phusangensis]|uniref:non-ribosomal peptide synthetase n=1 Tax=Acrocarpospora phusangensis TaxID=1070424 RepID=UPI001951096F|nr:non-ribosomal peptide synthetase [Acrocarpospora phusangensis]